MILLIEDYQTCPEGPIKQRTLNKIIKFNYKMVYKTALGYFNKYSKTATLELDDIIQAGCEGLIRAANKFVVSKGFSFSTYAYWWISSMIGRYIKQNSKIIYLPTYHWDNFSKIKKATRSYELNNNKKPSFEELAKLTGLSMYKVKNTLEFIRTSHTVSLDKKVGNNEEGGDTELIDMITVDNTDTEQYYQSELAELVKNCLECLTPREKEVMILKHGLNGEEPKNLSKVGEALTPSVSRERARQLLASALKKLRANQQCYELFQLYCLETS